MSIEAMKLALAALAAGTDRDLIGNARIALRTAIQQAEPQQPVTAIACGISGMAKTTCPYCEQGFAFEHEQPATGEPVGQVSDLFPSVRNNLHAKGFDSDAPLCTHPVTSEPATPEPVVSRNPFASRCYTMSESHLSGHRLIVGFDELGDAQDAYEWVVQQGRGDLTHPAPSVPTAWNKDLFLVVHAMEMNNWNWKSEASNDLKRDAHAAATRLYAATLAAKEGGAA